MSDKPGRRTRVHGCICICTHPSYLPPSHVVPQRAGISPLRISSLRPVIEGGQPVPSLGEGRANNLGTPRRHKPGSMGALRGEECNLRNHRRPSGHVCLSRRAFDDIMIASAWSTRYENRQYPPARQRQPTDPSPKPPGYQRCWSSPPLLVAGASCLRGVSFP